MFQIGASRLLLACSMALAGLSTTQAAEFLVTGVVADVSGQPLADAIVAHIGRPEAPRTGASPDAEEMRSDKDGRFKVAVSSPAIVIRKPGFISERRMVSRDMDVRITLRHIGPVSKCPVEVPPVKTKDASDIDYLATWTYIETKDGPKGIISGHGPLYSFGAPTDSNVRASVEYFEVMYEDGVVDARGHSGDDNYWRSQTIFGAAAQYYRMDRATAQILDCIMDGSRLKGHDPLLRP